MSNIKKGKIDSNNVSVLRWAASNLKALLMSPKTLEGMDKATLEDPIEVLYANQPLVNTGYLSEERPIIEPVSIDSIPPETELVRGDSSNPLNRAASRIVDFDVTRNTPIPNNSQVAEDSLIMPPASPIPSVTLDSMEQSQSIPVSSYEQPVSYDIPQIRPVNQPINNAVTTEAQEVPGPYQASDLSEIERAINTQVVQGGTRREIVEPSLQTPQEFETNKNNENVVSRSNRAEIIEEFRNEFIKMKEFQKAEKHRQVDEEAKKEIEEFNRGLDKISRANDMSEEQFKNDMQAIKMTVENSYQPNYNNGAYGR